MNNIYKIHKWWLLKNCNNLKQKIIIRHQIILKSSFCSTFSSIGSNVTLFYLTRYTTISKHRQCTEYHFIPTQIVWNVTELVGANLGWFIVNSNIYIQSIRRFYNWAILLINDSSVLLYTFCVESCNLACRHLCISKEKSLKLSKSIGLLSPSVTLSYK